MTRRCPRCLYRGAVLHDGYGDRCINCAWEPHEPIPDDILESLVSDNRRERHPPRLHKGKPEHDAEMTARILTRKRGKR